MEHSASLRAQLRLCSRCLRTLAVSPLHNGAARVPLCTQHGTLCCVLSQDVRAASVRALTQATLLALHRDDFKRMLGNLQVIMHHVFRRIVRSPLRAACCGLFAACNAVAIVAAELLPAQLWVYADTKLDTRFNPMIPHLLCSHYDRTYRDLDPWLFGLQDIRHMWRFEALRKVPLLAPLTPAQRSNLCTVLRAEHYKRGGVIIRQVLGDVPPDRAASDRTTLPAHDAP